MGQNSEESDPQIRCATLSRLQILFHNWNVRIWLKRMFHEYFPTTRSFLTRHFIDNQWDRWQKTSLEALKLTLKHKKRRRLQRRKLLEHLIRTRQQSWAPCDLRQPAGPHWDALSLVCHSTSQELAVCYPNQLKDLKIGTKRSPNIRFTDPMPWGRLFSSDKVFNLYSDAMQFWLLLSCSLVWSLVGVADNSIFVLCSQECFLLFEIIHKPSYLWLLNSISVKNTLGIFIRNEPV